MFKRKIEVIPFKDFMSRPAPSIQKKKPHTNNIYSFFPPITITSFFPVLDPSFSLFLLGGGIITAIAILEHGIASAGSPEISALISGFTKLAFPMVGFGVIGWFLLSL